MKTTRRLWMRLAQMFIVAIVLAACRQEEPTPAQIPVEPSASPLIETATPQNSTVQVAHYNLGETTIVQEHFPEDSPFRNMPVRLDGLIGVPGGEGMRPVVLIMHGSHADCPGENEWPCSVDEEQKNYEGFSYLVEAMAKAGYVSLAINVNAEHTFGFGESPPAVRTQQLVELHLAELAAANDGESDKFEVDLTGKVDLSQMTWLGHSRGGEFANRLLREHDLRLDEIGGEVQGLILIAPSVVIADSLPAADVSLAVLLPACDQDVINLEGQQYYESARLDPARQHLAMSVYINGANHNNFNAILEPERAEMPENRPDCSPESMLTADEQQSFLVQYTIDFLQLLYGEPDVARESEERLGILPSGMVPENLFGYPVELNVLPRTDDTLILILPQTEEELVQNLLGGETQMRNMKVTFCPAGYYVPDSAPGKEKCKRVNFNQPGYPQQLAMEWEDSGAEWRTFLPNPQADLAQFSALQLRAALDPLSELNREGEPQAFTVELVDDSGKRGQVTLSEIEFPQGVRQPNEFFEGDYFSGHVYMPTLRIPLEEFQGIDLSSITELALIFDQTETGAIFLADLSFVQDN